MEHALSVVVYSAAVSYTVYAAFDVVQFAATKIRRFYR